MKRTILTIFITLAVVAVVMLILSATETNAPTGNYINTNSGRVPEEDIDENDMTQSSAGSDIICGITNSGQTLQCSAGQTCFIYDGSKPACASDPCSVCAENETCVQLESYPVQIRCVERGVGGSEAEEEDGDRREIGEVGGNMVEEGDKTLDNEPATELVPDGVVTSVDLKITSISAGGQLASPVVIEGQARGTDKVTVQLTKLDGTVLISEVANVHGPTVKDFGNFKITLEYQFNTTKEGFVKVISLTDASVLAQVPVAF